MQQVKALASSDSRRMILSHVGIIQLVTVSPQHAYLWVDLMQSPWHRVQYGLYSMGPGYLKDCMPTLVAHSS